ncbi:MAG: hypothetical protein ACRDGU_01455 [Actinomycetota bacterium]
MFGSTILDVAIGLILTYLVLSLVCAAINEGLSGFTSRRARFLLEGLENLVGKSLAGDLLNHPLLRGMTRARTRAKRKSVDPTGSRQKPPSYIPSRVFALAFMDTAAKGKRASDEKDDRIDETWPAEVKTALAGLPKDVREAVATLARDVEGDAKKVLKAVETWFNEAMDRVSGWYKRRTQILLFVIGLVVVALTNADSLTIASTLWSNSTLRAAVAAEARVRVEAGETGVETGTPSENVEELLSLGLPIGWVWDPGEAQADDPRARPDDVSGWILKVMGLLFTAAALTMGAPFWFDTLKKFVSVRSSGRKPGEEETTGGPKGT